MGALTRINRWIDDVLSTDLGGTETKTALPSAPSLAGLMHSWGPFGGNKELNYPFQQSAVIYACVNLLASKLSALPLMLYKGFDDQREVARDPALTKLLDRPSPSFHTPVELWKFTVCGLMLPPGEVFWYMIGRGDKKQLPVAIQVISGNMLDPIRDPVTKWIVGWKWKGAGNNKKFFTYDEIIQFRMPNPYNQDRGLSPIEAAMEDAKIDWKAAQFNHQFFESGTQIGGTIEPAPGTVVNPEQADALRQQFSERHAGYRQSHGIVILPFGATYRPADITHEEMQFLESRRFNADQIIAVYPGVTRQSLGWTEDYNKANSEQAEKDLHVNGVRPVGNLIAWTLWSELLQYRPEKTWIHFEDKDLECLQKDKAAQASSFSTLVNSGLSKRNASTFLGMNVDMDKDPFADETYISGGLIPERLMESKVAMGALGEAGVGARALQDLRNLRGTALSAPDDEPTKAITMKAPRLPAKLFDPKQFGKSIKIKLKPLMNDAAKSGTEGVEEETGVSLGYDLQASEEWAKFMEDKWSKIVTIPENWHAYLRGVVARGIKAGKTMAEISLDLENRFRQGHPYWSMRISRTEVMDTLNASRFKTMKGVGVPYHGWSTAKDDAVRDSHQELEGKVVKVGEKFKAGLRYPHDPKGSAKEVIQCRCSTFPVYKRGEGEEERSIITHEMWQKAIGRHELRLIKQGIKALAPWWDEMLDDTLKSLEEMGE